MVVLMRLSELEQVRSYLATNKRPSERRWPVLLALLSFGLLVIAAVFAGLVTFSDPDLSSLIKTR